MKILLFTISLFYSSLLIAQTPPVKLEMEKKPIDRMALFQGCEEFSPGRGRLDSCSRKRLTQFIYKHLKCSTTAARLGERMVITFVINIDGTVADIKVLRDEHGCGDEVKRVFELMNKMDLRWTPGYQNGKKVRVGYMLPISYAPK